MKILFGLTLMLLFSGCSQKDSLTKGRASIASDSILVDFRDANPQVIQENLNPLNFGSELVYKVQVKNNTNTSLIPILDVTNSAPFSLSSNACPQSLNPRSSCYITFKLKNTFDNGNFESVILVNQKNIEISGSFIGKLGSSEPLAGLSFSSSSIEFGSIKTSEQKQSSLTIRNNNSNDVTLVMGSLTPANVIISSNTCGTTVKARKSCVVTFQITNVVESKVGQPLILLSNHPILYSVTLDRASHQLALNPLVSSKDYSVESLDLNDSIAFKNNGISLLQAHRILL